MGSPCNFCRERRAMVFCRSDAACLCLSCDRDVHSANALSRRHSRTLLCDRCVSQPAAVRCIEENIPLCQNCDWNGHAVSGSASGHKRQTVNFYSGCPTSAEFSRIWSFIPEFPPIADSHYEQGMGLMSISEDNARSNMDLVGTERTKNLENVDDFPWIASSSAAGFNAMICSADQPRALLDSSTHKLGCSGAKDLGICEDNFYEDFRVDDVDLTFENYEELFGTSNNSMGQEQLFGDVGIDSFFETKETPAAKSKSQAEYFAEVPSVGEVQDTLIAWGNGASADSLMSNLGNRADPNVCFPARQARSSLSLSLSGLTGESSAGDYQDCVVPSAMLMNELPWYPTGSDSSFTPANRDSAVKRYREKKKNRKFEKKIRYESRKARADVRKRVKGRFVKAGDTYDYDPLCETRRC